MTKVTRIFISYKYSTPQFSNEVQDLAAELMHFNLNVVLDQQELGYGSDVRDFMEHNIAAADVVLVIVTSDLNRALHSTGAWGAGARFEIERSLSKLSATPSFRLIPVLFDNSTPEGGLAKLKAIDLSDRATFRHHIARLAADLLLVAHPGYARGLLGDRYRVDRLIEQRGVAHVYVGFDTRLGTEVELYGVRGVSEAGDPRGLQLASRIARARARAFSPFLLNYRDFLPYSDGYEIVTERFVGASVETCLPAGHLLPAAHVCAQACLALIELHNVGLVQGGLVPRALRLGRNGRHAAVKIVDFEFASLDDEPTLDPGAISVYPMATPPEQWEGTAHTAKGDVYQLGALLFRLLTKRYLLNRATLAYMPFMANLPHVLIEELDAEWLRQSTAERGVYIDASDYADVIRTLTLPAPESRPSAREAFGLLLRLGADATGYAELLDDAQQRART